MMFLLFACSHDTQDTSQPPFEVVPTFEVVSARCDDLFEEDGYASRVIGWTSSSADTHVVILTSGDLWRYAEDYTLTTMGVSPDSGSDAQLAYFGDCPDGYRVFAIAMKE